MWWNFFLLLSLRPFFAEMYFLFFYFLSRYRLFSWGLLRITISLEFRKKEEKKVPKTELNVKLWIEKRTKECDVNVKRSFPSKTFGIGPTKKSGIGPTTNLNPNAYLPWSATADPSIRPGERERRATCSTASSSSSSAPSRRSACQWREGVAVLWRRRWRTSLTTALGTATASGPTANGRLTARVPDLPQSRRIWWDSDRYIPYTL